MFLYLFLIVNLMFFTTHPALNIIIAPPPPLIALSVILNSKFLSKSVPQYGSNANCMCGSILMTNFFPLSSPIFELWSFIIRITVINIKVIQIVGVEISS